MQINRIIQERRRALGMTQEQVAEALGVTAPAVNKWERGASCPDLGLLAPLARLLKTDLNELMGFHESLSDEEAQRLSLEIVEVANRDGPDAGFALAREKLREYPNSGCLAYTLAALLEAQLALFPEESAQEHRAELDRWYERAANCDDPRVRERTAAMLAGRHIARKDWDAAARAIEAMPERPGMDQRAMEAKLRLRRGEPDEAAKLLQGVVFNTGSELCAALQMLTEAELAAGEREAAMEVAKTVEAVVSTLGLWSYIGLTAPLQCAVEAKDAPEALRYLRRLLDALDEPWRPAESMLYRRIAGEKQGVMGARAYALMLGDLEANPEYGFLRGEGEFGEIVEEFRRRAEEA